MAAVFETSHSLDVALVDPSFGSTSVAEDATPPVQSPSRFARRLALLYLAIAALLFAAGLIADRVIRDFVWQSEQVVLTVDVNDELLRLQSAVKEADAAQRSYLATGDSAYLDQFVALSADVGQRLGALDASPLDDLPRAPLAEVAKRVRAHVAQLQAGLVAPATDRGALLAASAGSHRNLAEITGAIASIRGTIDAEIQQHAGNTHGTAGRLRVFGPVAMVSFLVVVAFVFRSMFQAYRRRMRAEADLNKSYVELADSLMEARTLAEQVRRLSEFGELLQSSNSIAEAMNVAATVLPGILPGCSGSIYLINASNNLLEHIGGFGEHELPYEIAFPPDDCWAIRRGQPFPPSEGTQFRCGHHARDAQGFASLCIPLAAQNEALGTLSLEMRGTVPAELRRAARSVSEQLSLALANLRLRETLRTQSVRDPLTGLFNRRYLEVSFARELVRATRRDAAVAILMIDVDHFKRFNDTHGHEAGDAVLGAVGQTLARLTRGEDIACRYGGEEFTVLLTEADTDAALRRAEELRAAIAQLQLEHRRVSLGGLSISIGVATFPFHGNDLDSLLHAADRALYRAKEAGRNQVVLAT